MIYLSYLHQCRFVGNLVALVEAGDIVDSATLEIHSAVLARVYVSAEDESRPLLHDRLGQLRRTEMLGVCLERTVNIAIWNAQRRMCNENVYP